MTKAQMLKSLGAAKANLVSKSGELQEARENLSRLSRQRDRAQEEWASLNDSSRADSATVAKLRSLSDEIERIDQVLAEYEGEKVPRLEADLAAMIDVGAELYREYMLPRVEAFEAAAAKAFQPYYSTSARAEEVARRTDAVTYLRSHVTCAFPPGIDPHAIAAWLSARLDFALKHDGDGVLPFGKNRPEPIGNVSRTSEPVAA